MLITNVFLRNDINFLLIRERLKMKKELFKIEEALFVIDMNNGFCEKGNLADSSIKVIVPEIITLIRKKFKKRRRLICSK